MSLSSWLARVFGKTQAEVPLVAAVADDGSGPDPNVGDLSPLRADPDTGAILVKDVSGAGGGGGATLAEQEAQTAILTSLDGKVTTATDTPTGTDPGVVVRLVQSGPILTSVQNQAFAGAIPGPSDSGQLVRVIPTDAVTVDQCLGVVLATDHQTITTSGRAFVASRPKGASLGADITSTDFNADHELLDVAVYQSALPAGAATDSGLTTISGGIETTNIALGNISTAQTDGTQKTQITNGVDSAGVLATDPTGTEQGLVVRPIPSGTQAVSAASLPLPTGASTEAKQDTGNASVASIDTKTPALVSGRVPVDGSGVTQPVSDAGASLTVDDGGSSLTVDGTVTANVGTTNGLALDATLTGGTQIAIAKGPVSPGAAVGAEKPVLVGGTDGTNAQTVNVDSTGAVRLQSGGTPGAAAPSRVTQVGGSDGTNLRALKTDTSGRPDVLSNLQVSSAAVTTTNPVPTRSVATELAPSWVRGPEDGFGRSVMVQPTPVLQSTFANGITSDIWHYYLTGTATATTTAQSDGLATVSTGATGSSISELTSIDSFSYRSGQNIRAAFTSLFSAPASGGFQVVGVGSSDGFAIGYNGTAFGFLVRRGGVFEIRTITITTASTTNQNVTVTLNGVGTSVAVTNSGNTVTTAREISNGDYSASGLGWDAHQFGSTVIFVSRQPGPLSGSYSLTATTAVGSFAQTLAGVTPTDTWHAKTAWTGDRLDGSLGANNLSGATLDPTKLSVWQVLVPYLGAGNIILQWFDPTTGRWTTCHTVSVANSASIPIVRNPMFRLWLRASGASNISASSASMALFCDGIVEPIGPRVAVPPSFKTNVGNAGETPLVAIRTERYFNGSENRAAFRPIEVTVSAGATGQVILRFYLNPTLTANNFGAVNALHPIAYDTASTASTNGLLVGAIITSPSGGSTPISLLDLGYALQPGDVVGVTAQQTSGTNATVAIAFTGVLDNGCGGI